MKESILIADDEPLARRVLRDYLLSFGWTGQIHEAHDGKTAISMANTHRPFLLFLDIVMPGATGLEVLNWLEFEPSVVFTTAYDQYAVTAFELGALDYLLKPFARERFERVFRRVQTVLQASGTTLVTRAVEALQNPSRLSRIFVRDGERILPLSLSNIERAQGADDYAMIHSTAGQYLISVRLVDLERHWARANFVRVHRSHLINLEFVACIEAYDAARVQVRMKSGIFIVASRKGSQMLRGLPL